MKPTLCILALAGLFAVPAAAPRAAETGTPAAASAPAADSLTAGEIRKVDKGAGKLTIRHEELKNLDMPPMTMVFGVRDPAMLDRVRQGDRVRFRAEKIDGRIVVTELRPER